MIRVMQMGLGPIGCRVAQLISQREELMLVGAMDIDPAKVGRTVAQVCSFEAEGSPVVGNSLEPLREWYPDVAVVTTTSRAESLLEQVSPILRAKVSVVSTCEELAYPVEAKRPTLRELDALARSNSVGVLGTGINPGFAMDALPLMASAPIPGVTRIEISRRVNLSNRRAQLQRKMGVGMRPEEADPAFASGKIGHVGLATSLALVAAGLFWKVDEIRLSHHLLVADRPYESLLGPVQPGVVIGGTQVAEGVVDGQVKLVLRLTMALEEANAGGEINFEGPLPFRVTLSDLQGDWATAAITVNSIASLLSASPGYHTMVDITPVMARGM